MSNKVSLGSINNTKQQDNNDKVHSKNLEVIFHEKNTGNSIKYIEEKSISVQTNHNDVRSSHFYKEQNGKITEISSQQATKEMMSLIERCLTNNGDITYNESRYLKEGQVLYSF